MLDALLARDLRRSPRWAGCPAARGILFERAAALDDGAASPMRLRARSRRITRRCKYRAGPVRRNERAQSRSSMRIAPGSMPRPGGVRHRSARRPAAEHILVNDRRGDRLPRVRPQLRHLDAPRNSVPGTRCTRLGHAARGDGCGINAGQAGRPDRDATAALLPQPSRSDACQALRLALARAGGGSADEWRRQGARLPHERARGRTQAADPSASSAPSRAAPPRFARGESGGSPRRTAWKPRARSAGRRAQGRSRRQDRIRHHEPVRPSARAAGVPSGRNTPCDANASTPSAPALRQAPPTHQVVRR